MRVWDEKNTRAFTIVELLVVVAIIIVLLSILIVAVNAAARTSQSASTLTLISSIKQGLVQFKEEIGYLPPVLAPDDPASPTDADEFRALKDPPDPTSGTYADDIQDWYSITSLAEYLLGYGHHYEDGYGVWPDGDSIRDWDKEGPPVGIRHPWDDGVWGASRGNGQLDERMGQYNDTAGTETGPYAYDQGRVYGPYLELKDERLLAAVVFDENGNMQLLFPGEGDDPQDFADAPKVIVDYWGNPLRYYRRVYPFGAIQSPYRNASVPAPTLSDVYVLRPWRIKEGAAIDALLYPDGNEDTSTTLSLRSAEFAIFSAGPDRTLDQTVRVDLVDFSNEDNVVETGP